MNTEKTFAERSFRPRLLKAKFHYAILLANQPSRPASSCDQLASRSETSSRAGSLAG